MFLLIGIGCFLLFQTFDSGAQSTPHSWGRVEGGVWALLLVAPLKLLVDLYSTLTGFRVEIDSEGVRDYTRDRTGTLYTWDEIRWIRVRYRAVYQSIEIHYRAQDLRGDNFVETTAMVRLNELSIPSAQRGALARIIAQHTSLSDV